MRDHQVARSELRTFLDELETELGPPDESMMTEAESVLSNLERRAPG